MAKRTIGNAKKHKGEAITRLASIMRVADFSDESCAQRFMEAESVIDEYQVAVSTNRSDLPSCESIGIACFWLLHHSNALADNRYFDLVVRLITPSVAISMYACLNEVQELRQHAIDSLKQQLVAAAPADGVKQHFNDVPF